MTRARYKAKYGQRKIKRAKSWKKKARKRQTDIDFALSWYPVQYLALFGPSQRKGLLEICNRKQTRKYDYMLNEVACKKENKTKIKFKKRDQTNGLHVCFNLES